MECNIKAPAQDMKARAAKRLHVAAAGVFGVAGEYKILDGATVNGRPAYRLAVDAADGCATPHFLVWLPRGGGFWVFSTEVPHAAADAAPRDLIALGDCEPLARSTQVAWTALPDELMSTSWTKASWNQPRVPVRIAVIKA